MQRRSAAGAALSLLFGTSISIPLFAFGCAGESAPPATPSPGSASTAPSASTAAAPPTSASSAATAWPSSTASASAAPATGKASCELPPVDLVHDNIGATSISGIGEILSSAKVSLDGKTPVPTTGYVNFRYEVKVLKWFSGTGTEKMVLHQGAEATSMPARVGNLLFFSACALPDGSGSEPDVGYFFSLDPSCRAEAEKRGETAAKGVTKKAKPKACTSMQGK